MDAPEAPHGHTQTIVAPPNEPRPSRPKGHKGVWIAVIVLIVLGVGIYLIRSRNESSAKDNSYNNSNNDQPISVGVSPVQKQDVPFYLTGLGTVTAFNTVTVHTRVDGQIMKIYFQEGQFVHAGDLLAEIDPRPYQVALDQAQGQLAKDLASQNDARIDLSRYQQLFQSGVVARQQVDTQAATVGQYDGAIQSDRAQINNEKLQLEYCHVTSPIDGRVGLRLVDQGNIVHAADTNGMLVITQVRPIAVDFTLPEDQLPQVVSEMKDRRLTVEAYSRDDKTLLATGALLTIDNQIDTTTGTIKLKSQFPNSNLSLWPNQFVNTRLFLSVRKNAIVIPSAAIQKGSQGTFVYIVGSDNKATVRAVQADFGEGNISVMHGGLTVGEQVVIDGADKLQDGSMVSPHTMTVNGTPANSPESGQHP